ncbi:MAG: cell envelope integrity protein TolA [Giesbergeria sp.]
MHAPDDRDQFIPPRPPGRTRAVTLAVVAHLILVAALTWGVAWKTSSDQPAVVAELWAAVPQQAAPRAVDNTPTPPQPPKPPAPEPPAPPQPKPAPPPPPEPPQRAQPDPHEADIAIERDKQRVEKEKREREEKQKLEREKKLKEQQHQEQEKKDKLAKEKIEREKAEREKAEHDKEQKRLAEEKRKKDDAIEKANTKAAEVRRQENIRRMQGLAGATGAATATGKDLHDAGPSGGYGGRVAAKVKPNIVYPDVTNGNPRAEVEVNTSPDGTIVSTRLTKSSGNKAWDDAVLRALEKTAALPRDVDGRVPSSLVIGFRPQD